MPLPLKKSRRKKSTDAHSEPWWLANMPTMVYECSHDVSVVVVREIADIIKAWKLFCTPSPSGVWSIWSTRRRLISQKTLACEVPAC